jgi:hypothetical protein
MTKGGVMLARLNRPLGISILSNATLHIPGAPRASSRKREAASEGSLGQSVTRQDLDDLPARLPLDASNALIPSHDLDVRYKGLWHGILASPDGPSIPDTEGFHPGTTPAFPKALLIHPDIRYLRRDVLYFPYLRHGDEDFLLCLLHCGRRHTPFLIGIDGLIVPYVYVSEENSTQPTFPGDPARCCGLRR